jgi:methylmalonyl-CoA mutase N-terminal domain/subunit
LLDLPTHRGGKDSDQRTRGDVGKRSCHWHCEDMKVLFDQIPLSEMSL